MTATTTKLLTLDRNKIYISLFIMNGCRTYIPDNLDKMANIKKGSTTDCNKNILIKDKNYAFIKQNSDAKRGMHVVHSKSA